MKLFFKIAGCLFAALFLVSAVLQYNDPDPYIWIAVYVLGALVSVGFVLDKISFKIPLLVGILSLVGFFYIFPDKFEGFSIMEGEIRNIEEGREAFGLLILTIVMFTYALRIRFKNKL